MRKNCGFSNCYLEGSRGEKDAIEVRKTKTLPPDRKALVIDAYSFGKYILDFEIAMRGTGPTGLSVNLTKQEVVKVPLNKNGEAREINLEDNSDFIILVFVFFLVFN